MKKSVVIFANLILGNSILWFFEMLRKQDHLDVRLVLGFSSAALVLLWIAFRLTRTDQSWLRSITLAAAVSFLVPVFGLMFSFFDPSSLNGSLVGAVVAVVLGPILWTWATPMFVVNVFLFQWLAKSR